MTDIKEVRYQDCPWYIRLWRRRWYLMVPFWAIKTYFTPWVNPRTGKLAHEEPFNTWSMAWSIAIGTAQGEMKWYYTWDEVFEDLKSK